MKSVGVSITRYAVREARRSVLRLSIAGFASLALVAISASVFAYYQRLDYVARAVESNIESSLLVGDTFQLRRLAESLSRSDGVLAVSIFDSRSGKLIAQAGDAALADRGRSVTRRFGFLPTFSGGAVTLRHYIESSSEKIGTLEIICALPIGLLGGLLGVIVLMFLVVSYSIVAKAKRTALAVTTPTELFARELKSAADSGVLRELSHQDLRFSELIGVQAAFKALLEKLAASREQEKQVIQEAIAGRIASKVRHDVKQALLASNAVAKRLEGRPEDKALMNASLQRIESTVNEIPKIKFGIDNKTAVPNMAKPPLSEAGTHLVVGLVEPVCAEFRALIADSDKSVDVEVVVTGDQMQLFVNVEAARFRRMLVNLLANALDAIEQTGKIQVEISIADESAVVVRIIDDGNGISAAHLPKIGTPGFSHGKKNGSGLGLSSAFEYVSEWQGEIKVNSIVGKGTTIEIVLPRAAPHSSFLSALVIPANSHIVILDDDPTVHQIWRERLLPEELKEVGVSVSWFFDGDEARKLVEQLKREDREFLILADYDLGHGCDSGLDVIRKLGVCDRSVVMSSNAEDADLIRECKVSAVPLVPKALQPYIPIQVA